MSKPKKIFIVDDDKMLAMMLRDHLSAKTPHEFHLFSTGEECLKHLSEKPDLIILDYYLDSEMKHVANGMAILEAIKKQNRQIPVVMLSGQESYGIAAQTIAKGAAHYVLKGKGSFTEIEDIISHLK
ncbi:MAG: response regulator [Chitinophagales bacterium]|nr:response regulator [Chitinophagales bacterium]